MKPPTKLLLFEHRAEPLQRIAFGRKRGDFLAEEREPRDQQQRQQNEAERKPRRAVERPPAERAHAARRACERRGSIVRAADDMISSAGSCGTCRPS